MTTRKDSEGTTAMFFSSDQPIPDAAHDAFQRTPFARALADQLVDAPTESGFVVGLLGPWGSGKSSILNIVYEDLGQRSGVVPVRFNPWLFSGAEQLVFRFFHEIAAELQLRPEGRIKALAERLAGYGASLAWFDAVPLVGVPVGIVGKISGALRERFKQRREAESAIVLRDRLKKALAELDRRIVVLIDDVDRLESAEIRDVMRLVRLTAELPNMVFLVAFDRERVEQALNQTGSDGRAYLSKILQVTYDVPSLRQPDVAQFLLNGLVRTIEGLPQGPLNLEVWQNLFGLSLRSLFQSVRDVKRYLNAVPIMLKTVGEEIALADALALEAVRCQLPDVYALLPESVRALTSTDERDRHDETEQARVDRILEAAGPYREATRNLLIHLFPAGRRYVDKMNHGPDWQNTWARERRVAHERTLRFFLERSLPAGEMSNVQIHGFFEVLGNAGRLEELLNALKPDELEHALGRLEAYEGRFPPEVVEAALPVLMNQQSRLREGHTRLFDFGADLALDRIALRLLSRIRDEAERERIVVASLPQIRTLSARQNLIDLVGHQENAGHELVSRATWETLKVEFRSQVLCLATEDFARERDPIGVLIRARDGANDVEKERLQALAGATPVFRRLLAKCLNDGFSQTMGEVALKRNPRLAWDLLEEFVGKDILPVRVQELAGSREGQNLDERGKEALELAKRYLTGWRPSLRPGTDDEEVP